MSREKILVVDYEQATAGNISLQLTEMGYSVLAISETRPEDLAEIRLFSPDLLLLNISPHGDMGGVETARIIMREFPVPAIFLSGKVDNDTLLRVLDIRPPVYASKPLPEPDIDTTISLALTTINTGGNSISAKPDNTGNLWQVKFTCNTDGKITRIHHGSKKTLQNIGIDNYQELFPDSHEQQIKAGIVSKKQRLIFKQRNENILCCEYSPLTDNVVNVIISGQPVLEGRTGTSRLDNDYLPDILDRLTAAIILFNDKLNIIYQNKSAQNLLNNGTCLGNFGGYLTCHNPEITAELKEMVGAQKDHLLSIDRGEQQKALNILVSPVNSGRVKSEDRAATALLFAFEITDDYARIEEVIRGLYHLSPMEAKLVTQLFITPHLATAATALGITLNTARTHLKRIYSKTHVNRISSLIHLIVTGPASVMLHINV